jgi:hypothetical protein
LICSNHSTRTEIGSSHGDGNSSLATTVHPMTRTSTETCRSDRSGHLPLIQRKPSVSAFKGGPTGLVCASSFYSLCHSVALYASRRLLLSLHLAPPSARLFSSVVSFTCDESHHDFTSSLVASFAPRLCWDRRTAALRDLPLVFESFRVNTAGTESFPCPAAKINELETRSLHPHSAFSHIPQNSNLALATNLQPHKIEQASASRHLAMRPVS